MGRPNKLTQDQVIVAMTMIKKGSSYREVAKKFAVSHQLLFQYAKKAEIDTSNIYDWEAIKLAIKDL